MPDGNLDRRTVRGFGDEWARFDQSSLDPEELQSIFESYFRIFPWERLPDRAIGFDMGCGSGRWARVVARRVGKLYCIDASAEALEVASRNLQQISNCEVLQGTFDAIPLKDGSMDFAYCLGVLHHIPNPAAGIRECVRKLKRGAPFLVYLYYAFDNKPLWYRELWQLSDALRHVISRLPTRHRNLITFPIALLVYFPLARLALLLEHLGLDVASLPLSAYRHRSLYTMKTDALDRFGTRLEKRFTAVQIRQMLEEAGLGAIRFSNATPYWCSVGYRL